MGFSKNMVAIKQHAIVEKRAGEGMFAFHFLLPSSCFGFNLRHMVMTHMYCEMQNKLSNNTFTIGVYGIDNKFTVTYIVVYVTYKILSLT